MTHRARFIIGILRSGAGNRGGAAHVTLIDDPVSKDQRLPGKCEAPDKR